MTTQDAVKAKPAPKKRKPAVKKKAVTPPTHTEIAILAEKFWIERGKTDGYAEHDWLRAEQELHGKAS